MSEGLTSLRDALGRLFMVLNQRLEYYEDEFSDLTCQCDVGPCADTRRTKYYLGRLLKELDTSESVEGMTRAVHATTLLVHATNLKEPMEPSLPSLAGQDGFFYARRVDGLAIGAMFYCHEQ